MNILFFIISTVSFALSMFNFVKARPRRIDPVTPETLAPVLPLAVAFNKVVPAPLPKESKIENATEVTARHSRQMQVPLARRIRGK